MENRPLIISDADQGRLAAILDSARMDGRADGELEVLEGELGRARIVPADRVPADVITMNSVVRLRDLDSDETELYELVYPADADAELGRISVLAPIGTAILGYRLGDLVECLVPAGLRRLRVEGVLHQPEWVGA